MAYIIAEIGFNHEGDVETAEKMIRAAAAAGADAVKFQTFRASDIVLPTSPHYENIKHGEMDLGQHIRLRDMAGECGVDFLSTPFSSWAVDLLEEVGVPAYKVASMDCVNKHLLSCISRTGKPIYLSTGMASLEEIADALNFLKEKNSGPITLLHCLSLYPANAGDLNLEAIPFLKNRFAAPVGYSDHHPGIAACIVAFMLGADVIETHFTLDSSKEGGDHHHSAGPQELKKLIETILLFDAMRGDGNFIRKRPDRAFVTQFRRGVYAARDLSKGHRLTENDLLLSRPRSELSPNDLEYLIGKVLHEDVSHYDPIKRRGHILYSQATTQTGEEFGSSL